MQDFQCFVNFITEFYREWPEIPRAAVRCLQLYDSSQGKSAYDKTVQLITILLERSPPHVLSFIISFIPLPKDTCENDQLKNNNSKLATSCLKRDSDGNVIIEELRYSDYNLYRWLEQLPDPKHFTPKETSGEASSSALSLSSNYDEISEAEDLSHTINGMDTELNNNSGDNREENDKTPPKINENNCHKYPWTKVIGRDLPWTLENMALFRGVTCEEVLRDINKIEEINYKLSEKEEEINESIPVTKKTKYNNSPTIIVKNPHVEIRKVENESSTPLTSSSFGPDNKNVHIDKSRNLPGVLAPKQTGPGRNVKTLYMVPFHPGHPRPIPPPPAQPTSAGLTRWRYHMPGPPPHPPPSGSHLHFHRTQNNFFNGPPIVRPWIPNARLPQKRPPHSGFVPHPPNFTSDGSLMSCRIICKPPQMLGNNSVRMPPPPLVVTSTASCPLQLPANDSLPPTVLDSAQLYPTH